MRRHAVEHFSFTRCSLYRIQESIMEFCWFRISKQLGNRPMLVGDRIQPHKVFENLAGLALNDRNPFLGSFGTASIS